MLPTELFILKRALQGRKAYTFCGTQKLCHELEEVDSALERIRHAERLDDVQAALAVLGSNRTQNEQPAQR